MEMDNAKLRKSLLKAWNMVPDKSGGVHNREIAKFDHAHGHHDGKGEARRSPLRPATAGSVRSPPPIERWSSRELSVTPNESGWWARQNKVANGTRAASAKATRTEPIAKFTSSGQTAPSFNIAPHALFSLLLRASIKHLPVVSLQLHILIRGRYLEE
jgi:hypothetical protein